MKIRRFLLSFLCLMMAFGLYGEDNDHAKTAYKRISNDFGKLVVSEDGHIESVQHLSWDKAEQSLTIINGGENNYILESLTNTDGTTDSLWVKKFSLRLNNKQRLGVNETMFNNQTKRQMLIHGMYIFIDKPANNPDFEQRLCKLILNKNAKKLEDAGEKFVNSFNGITIGNVKSKAVLIRGRSLNYNPGKYYSYAYGYTNSGSLLDITAPQSIVKNIIYDIQNQKVLSLSDVLTPEEIAHLGLKKKSKADLALDNYFLYVGIDGKPVCTYALSRENWNKFTGVLQNLIAPYDSLPAKIDSTYYVLKDYEGIQPTSISYKIKQKPSFRGHTDSLLVYLKSHLALPDTMKHFHSWKIQFVVGKDGKLSHVETTPEKNGDGDESFAAKLTETFEQMPAWQPLDFAGLNVQNSLLTYYVKFVPNPTLGDDHIYEMPETFAQFPGGEVAYSKWISEHIHYPANCMRLGVQGRVIVRFAVNEDGSISDVEILRSPDPALSREAERVVKMMPKWIPAMLDGKPVRSMFNLPIMFRLGSSNR